MTDKTKKILGIVGNVVIWVFVAFSLLTTIFVMASQNNSDGVPSLFGKTFISIQTDSMDPTYKEGDMVFLTKLDAEGRSQLEAGDIITFHSPEDINGDGKTGDINTHRIDHIEGEDIYTKGDKKGAPIDKPISYGDIIGQCTEKGKIRGLGGVLDFLRSSLGFFLCVVLPMLLFFLYELYNFITLLVSRKATANAAQNEEEIKRKAIEEYLAQQNATQAPSAEQASVEETQESPVEEKTEDSAQE